jgi:hypothetical protein
MILRNEYVKAGEGKDLLYANGDTGTLSSDARWFCYRAARKHSKELIVHYVDEDDSEILGLQDGYCAGRKGQASNREGRG